MKQNVRNNSSAARRVVGHLAAEKKKAVVAFGLITVMAIMWVRVLTRQGPDSAGAAPGQSQADVGGSGEDSQLQISFVELPKTPGRNDVLSRDFFDCQRWRHFRDARSGDLGAGQVNVVSQNGSDQIMRQIAAKLKLLAISTESNPYAYINDRLLAVGDKLPVKEGDNTYEFEVTVIEANAVHLRCRDSEIRLELSNVMEAAD
ncbi:MAG: hypothetical protein ACYTEL_06780 [Planctomycetota bacterium]|jgi:hypothetical protein